MTHRRPISIPDTRSTTRGGWGGDPNPAGIIPNACRAAGAASPRVHPGGPARPAKWADGRERPALEFPLPEMLAPCVPIAGVVIAVAAMWWCSR